MQIERGNSHNEIPTSSIIFQKQLYQSMRNRIVSTTALAILLTLQLATPQIAVAQISPPTHVVVHQLEGANYTRALATIGKFTLTDNKLCLVFTDGQIIDVCPISNLGSLTFESKTTAISNIQRNEITVTLSPNPTSVSVYINGVAEGAHVNIFDIAGHIVLRGAAPAVELSALPKGVYLLQVATQVVKVIRK